MDWQILVVAVFFLGMGLAAFVSPVFVVGRFGFDPDSPDARNEVRAVYGGFGVAVAGLLIASAFMPIFKPGILVAVAISLVGMASGRLVAAAIEGLGKWPLVFLVVELLLAGLLISSML